MLRLRDSILKLDVSRSYSETIQKPTQKLGKKDEIVVEDDSEYFKKYVNLASSSATTDSNTKTVKNDETAANTGTTGQNSKVAKFF